MIDLTAAEDCFDVMQMNTYNLHIDFIPDGVLEYVIVERALNGSQGL